MGCQPVRELSDRGDRAENGPGAGDYGLLGQIRGGHRPRRSPLPCVGAGEVPVGDAAVRIGAAAVGARPHQVHHRLAGARAAAGDRRLDSEPGEGRWRHRPLAVGEESGPGGAADAGGVRAQQRTAQGEQAPCIAACRSAGHAVSRASWIVRSPAVPSPCGGSAATGGEGAGAVAGAVSADWATVDGWLVGVVPAGGVRGQRRPWSGCAAGSAGGCRRPRAPWWRSAAGAVSGVEGRIRADVSADAAMTRAFGWLPSRCASRFAPYVLLSCGGDAGGRVERSTDFGAAVSSLCHRVPRERAC